MTRRWVFLLPMLLLCGCTYALPTSQVTGTTIPAGPRLTLQPAGEDDGLTSLSVNLPTGAWSVQTLPSTWDTATLRLEHPTVLSQARQKTLIKGSDIVASGSTYVATSALGGALRPRNGYVLTVSLWNGGSNSTLVGEKQVPVNLVAGPNAVAVPIEIYPALSLTGFSPATGSPGTTVTLSGQGFSVLPSITQLTFGAAGDMQALSPNTLSSASITATLPSSMSPGSKTWQVQVGSSLAARSGFTVIGTSGGSFEVTSVTSQQQEPAIAFGNGQYLATWTDSRPTSGAGIYGVRLASDGSPIGSEFLLSNPAQSCTTPALAFDSKNNRFLAVYESNNTIIGQLVAADGTLLGGSFTLSNAQGTRIDAKAVYDATNDQYFVVWTDARAGTYQIYGQRISSSGSLLGSNLQLVQVATVAQSRAHVAYSATANKFLVVNTSQSSPQKINGRIVNPDGTFGSGILTIGSGSGNQTDPAVAADPVTGDFFTVWDSAVTGFRDSILGQRVAATGALVGGAVTVSSFNSTKKTPAIAYEAGRGTFLVAWGDDRNADTDLYGAHVNLNGTMWGSEFPVIGRTNMQSPCDVAVDATARKGLVLFQETAGTNNKVYGQLTYY